MRNPRVLLACGVLVLALAAVSIPGTAAAASRPHPLFGNSVLGNSAEIVQFRPSGSTDADSLRITDFDSASDPDLLLPGPQGALFGGFLTPWFEQLDLAAGDFDGDGRDDLVAAYSQPTANAWIQDVRLVVTAIDGATLGWAIDNAAVVATTELAPGSYSSQGNVRLAPGNFDADAPQEFVLATRTNNAIVIRLMELDDQRVPVPLATIVGQAQGDGLKESARFDVAAGDYDGDGVDEITVGGVRARADNGNMEMFVTVYAYESGALVPRATTSYGNEPQGNTSLGQGVYFDHVAIAAGRLRPGLTDQILVSWSYRFGEWWAHEWGCGILHDQWEWWSTTRPYLATLVVDTTGGSWTIGGWSTDLHGKYFKEQIEYLATCESRSDPLWTTPSLGVAVGDLTGDGVDEVVWAALDRMYVYQAATVAPYALTQRDSVSRSLAYCDPSRRIVDVADLDASAGGAGEWRSEIVLQDWENWGTSNRKHRIRVFRATTGPTGLITDVVALGQLLEPTVLVTNGDMALVTGDFDGDGIRLGEPTEHAVTDAIHPGVVLGAPPVHFDEFGGVPYDLTGCYPGYACDDFKSSYSVENTQNIAVETQIGSDWGLSATLKGYASGFGAKVEASFGATYGQGFSRTGSHSRSYRATNTVSTSGGDRILADVLNYDLWEYPVYGPGRQLLGHVSVLEPGSMDPEVQWFTFDSWALRSGSGAPAITHEPGNILSYPKAIPGTGIYGDGWRADANGWEVGSVGYALRPTADYSFDMTWGDIAGGSFTKTWKAGFEVGASISYEAEDPLGEIKAGVSAEVKGTYEMSELSTHTVTVGQEIHIGATLGNLGGSWQAPYFVYPYVFRSSTTGTLVLDYRVVPGGVGTWWDAYRGAPDLTFILPRLHHAAKGIPLQDPTTRERSPDVRVYPGTAAVGETVLVRAIVRNFGLLDLAGPVSVRFRADPPGGSPFLLADLDGHTSFELAGPIPSREGRPVTIQWVVPAYAADTLRIYAEVDPGGLIGEVHEDNNRGYVEFYAVGGHPVGVDGPDAPPGVAFRLEPGVPNPFRGSTRIAFGLPEKQHVRLEVYDIAGRRVAKLVDAELAPGRHEVQWNGRDDDGNWTRSGVFLCRVTAGGRSVTGRLVRLD